MLEEAAITEDEVLPQALILYRKVKENQFNVVRECAYVHRELSKLCLTRNGEKIQKLQTATPHPTSLHMLIK